MRQTAGADMVSAKLKARKITSGMIMLHAGPLRFCRRVGTRFAEENPADGFRKRSRGETADKRQHNDGCQRHGEKSAGTIGDSAESRHIDQKFSEKTVERRQSAD